MADSIRGDGLDRATRALAGLQRDPDRLERDRRRFNSSPPPYRASPSGTTTDPGTPETEEEQFRQGRLMRLGIEHEASKPYRQYLAHQKAEMERIFEANRNRTRRIKVGDDPRAMAKEIVKKRWVEQGIWNSRWNSMAAGKWRHEEPLEIELESDDTPQSEPQPALFSVEKPDPITRLKSNAEQLSEQNANMQREREASRPYHQFIYQVSQEREQIMEESTSAGGTAVCLHGINTMAYENVKAVWNKRGIWDTRWGVLPGMSWKHEEPFAEQLDRLLGLEPAPISSSGHETEKASPRTVKFTNKTIFGGHNEQAPLLAPQREPRRSKRPTSSGGGRSDGAQLPRPVRPSKVSKAPKDSLGPKRKRRAPRNNMSEALLLPSKQENGVRPKAPSESTSRRSLRIQQAIDGEAHNPIPSQNGPKSVLSSKSRHTSKNGAMNKKSAKPQGVSKSNYPGPKRPARKNQ